MAYDIRGVYGKDLDETFAEKLGKALGTMFDGEAEISVGRDVRTSSLILQDYLIKGLISTGCDVCKIGFVPNPITYFHTFFNRKTAGIYVTASHNPPAYNGFKLIRSDGSSLRTKERNKLKAIFDSEKFIKGTGKYEENNNALEQYREYLNERIKIEKQLKLVVECFHGSISPLVPKFFQNFNLKIIKSLHAEPLGDFGGFNPDPTYENVDQLRKDVVEKGAEFGVAFDGDGDRAVFVDNEGNFLSGGSMSILFAKEILNESNLKGKIIASIDCPSEIVAEVEKQGGEIVWSRIGHTFIEEEILKQNGLFAGELSSHFYFGNFYPFSDGILATLLLAKILSSKKNKLHNIMNTIKIYPTRKIYIDCGDHEKKNEVMKELEQELMKKYDNINTLDGLKLSINKVEWVLIRPSNTTPAINLAIEARDNERLQQLQERFTRIIQNKL